MNRFVRQCDEICFCVFYKCGFLMRGNGNLQWHLCCDFEKWNKQLCRDKSCQFRPPKKAKKEVSLLEVSKTSQYSTKRSGLLMFPEIGKLQVKKISFLYSGQGCLQSVQGLEERLEDLQSLSLNFCLTKFVRTIERAFVQVSHSFANWFLNARVWIP